MKKLRTVIPVLLALVLLGGITVYATTAYGTESDPLITMSYLDGVLAPKMEQEYAQKTRTELEALETRVKADYTGSYQPLTVAAGQTMTCEAGCEFLARSGNGVVTGKVLDITDGKTMDQNGGLFAHHLYMAVEDGAAVKAIGDTVLMVRGDYTIS